LPRYQRQLVAGLDIDLTADGQRVVVARYRQRIAESGLQKRVVSEPVETLPDSAVEVQLHAVAARAPHVVEITLVGQRSRADEKNVVLVGRAERAGVPLETGDGQAPPEAGFVCG